MQQHKESYQERLKNVTEQIVTVTVQIRGSILNLLGSDETLGERIRQFFREQGVTIVSILTAIGMAISTLADKATAALPEIIDGVFSSILKTASKGVEWLESNLWALFVALGGVLLGLVFRN